MWWEQKSGTWGDSRVCHWCSYHILTSSVIYYWTDAQQHGIYLFYIMIKKQTTTDKAFSFFFCHKSKAGLCPLWRTRKKAIWRKLLSIQNAAISLVAMRSKESWLVQGYHATVKLDSKVASPVMKTYSESRTELQNLQILKKILEKSSQFLPSEQPCESKSLEVALKIAASEKIRSENLRLWSTWRPFNSSFEWKVR